jgi:hypothetical protein
MDGDQGLLNYVLNQKAMLDDLHFTITNATVAQLETKNAAGNIFIGDIGCGQTGCPSPLRLFGRSMISSR